LIVELIWGCDLTRMVGGFDGVVGLTEDLLWLFWLWWKSKKNWGSEKKNLCCGEFEGCCAQPLVRSVMDC
ncbi:hypothetical protein Droror1_Dr00018084, partial [Drosera rotundifolia]